MRIGVDSDGTLIDSKYRHYKLLEELVPTVRKSATRTLSYDHFIAYKECGYSTLNYLDMLGIEDSLNISNEWIKHIEDDIYLECDQLFPDAITFLDAMHRKSMLYLVTARIRKETGLQEIHKLGIAKYFEEIIIVNPGKAAGVAKAERTRGLNLKVTIGDSEIDSIWAELLGVRFFALNRGFRNKQWWEKRGIRSYNDLLAVQKDIEQCVSEGK